MIHNLNDLYQAPRGIIETRWASPENWKGEKGAAGKAFRGRKGSACFPLGPGESKVLAESHGRPGTIRRMWIVMTDIPHSARVARGMRIEFFWDGAAKPAVSAPLLDFFGQGLGRMTVLNSAIFSNPEARSCNTCVPMPFRDSMRVVLTNDTDQTVPMIFYDIDYTLGDEHDDNMLYFHAHWRREFETKIRDDYAFLPRVHGRGRFLGVNIGIMENRAQYFMTWHGEGEAKIYLDGDNAYPTLSGTGMEDYVGSAWGYGVYSHPYQGCIVADREKGHYCIYRYHIPDPVYFYQDCRATIQQIGGTGPGTEDAKKFIAAGTKLTGTLKDEYDMTGEWGNFERSDDYSSCAYFYLDRPESNLPDCPPVEVRLEGLVE